MPQKGQLFILTGPSGVGKSTVEARVRELMPHLVKVVTYTTRVPRPHERNGVHYHFVSEAEFKDMVRTGEFLEWAQVYTHLYGNSKQSVLDALDDGHVVMVIDVQGATTIKQRLPKFTHTIFIQPETVDALKKHLQARDKVDPEESQARLSRAQAEIARAHEFDFVVTNKEGRIEQTVAEIAKIIQNVEKARRS